MKEFDELILSGAIEPVGIDPETGEMLYNFTSKIEKINPALHREAMNMVNENIMKLWEMGFVDINITDDNPIVRLNLKSFDEQAVTALEPGDRYALKEVIRICSNK